jgi:hypothetical protein
MELFGRLVLYSRPRGANRCPFLDTKCNAEDQGLSEGRAVPSNSAFAILSLSGARRRGLQVTGSPDVVDRVVANFSLNSSGASEIWIFGYRHLSIVVHVGDSHILIC